MAAAKVSLNFVVRIGDRTLGSAKMRGPDLARIVSPHLDGRFQPNVTLMPRSSAVLQRLWARTRPRGGIYFMTTSSWGRIDPEAVQILKSRACRLCFDYVDRDLDTPRAAMADAHVCSSYAQRDLIRAMQAAGTFAAGPTPLIAHNADADLYDQSFRERPAFAAVYCGNLINTSIPEPLADEVAFLDASKPRAMRRNRSRLDGFALHYCFRNRGHDRTATKVKPFTKGMNAAVCGANLVTSRDVPDAVALLGDDYPFLADSMDDRHIVEAFDRARDAFNGPDWRRGLDRMAGLRDEVSGQKLAAQFRHLAEELDMF
jgi:hypothetical protein